VTGGAAPVSSHPARASAHIPARAARAVAVAALFLAAAWLRARFLFAWSPPGDLVFSDMRGFVERAQNLLDGRMLPNDVLYPPGQHLLIALSARLLGGSDTLVLGAHLAAGLLTCFWMWRGSERLLGRGPAIAVLAIAAFHFPFLALSGTYLAETIFTAWLALLFFLLARWKFPWNPREALAIGVVAAAGTLWKGTNQLFVPILAVWSLGWRVTGARAREARAASGWVFLLTGYVAVLLSQGLYFRAFHGEFLPVAAGGAYNFTLGKCPGSKIVAKDGANFRSPRAYYTGEGGVQAYDAFLHDQRFFWRRGLDCVRARPSLIITSLREVGYLFAGNLLWPANVTRFERASRIYQRAFALFLIPGAVLGLAALARKPFSPRAAPFVLVPSICASAYLFLGELRFRIPFDVAFIPLAVLGWAWALAWTPRATAKPGPTRF